MSIRLEDRTNHVKQFRKKEKLNNNNKNELIYAKTNFHL